MEIQAVWEPKEKVQNKYRCRTREMELLGHGCWAYTTGKGSEQARRL